MKFFTKEWFNGEWDDEKIEKILELYNNYTNENFDKFPFVLKTFIKHLNLHDGKITHFFFNSLKKSLEIEGIFGNLQSGYYLLKITYCNLKDNLKSFSEIFNETHLEILSDEIDIDSESFIHRILFTSLKEIEIEIKFQDIQISMENTSEDKYFSAKCNTQAV